MLGPVFSGVVLGHAAPDAAHASAHQRVRAREQFDHFGPPRVRAEDQWEWRKRDRAITFDPMYGPRLTIQTHARRVEELASERA